MSLRVRGGADAAAESESESDSEATSQGSEYAGPLHMEAAQQAAGSYNCMGSMAEPVDDHVQHWIATLEKRGLDCATSIAECAEELAKDLRRLMQTDTGHVICFNHGAWKADDGPFKYMEADAFGLPSKKSAADGNCGACKWHSDAVLFGCSACAAKEPADGALCVLLYQDLPPSSHWANGRAYDVTMAKPSCAVQAALDQPGRAHRTAACVHEVHACNAHICSRSERTVNTEQTCREIRTGHGKEQWPASSACRLVSARHSQRGSCCG